MDLEEIFNPSDLSEDLLKNNDKVGDVININKNVEELPALAVVNGKYIGVGIDHQAAAEKVIREVQVKPYTVSRGFFDIYDKVAFLITYVDKKGSFIGMLQSVYGDYKDEGMPTNSDDFSFIARCVKQQLQAKKVYALHIPETGQLTRLAKKI